MEMAKRDCSVQMTLSRCRHCGQQGTLTVNGQEYEFATTDGLGHFFGRLIGIMSSFLGCCGPCDQQFFDREAEQDNSDDGHFRLFGSILWEYEGRYWEWKVVRNVESLCSWREENDLIIHVTECSESARRYTLTVPIRDFAYAVAKCATEVIKREGFWGYYDFAEKCEDFNLRQFLYVKAYALGVLEEMGYTARKSGPTCIRDELDLLMFDM